VTDDVGVVAPVDPRAHRLRPSVARLRTISPVVLVAGAAVLGVARFRQVSDTAPLGWTDTTDFLASSQASWLSPQLWAGKRPVGAPLLLKLVGGDLDAYVAWQASFAVLCWSLLAASVASAVDGRVARWGAALIVLAFSLTSPVMMWEPSVLSESLAISSLALVVAAGAQVARGITGGRVAVLLVALGLWSAIRDSHAAVVLLGGAAAALVAATSWLVAVRRRGAPSGGDTGDTRDDGQPADGSGPVDDRAGSLRNRGSAHDRADPRPSGHVPPAESPASAASAVAGWRRPAGALGVGALALSLVVMFASSHGERHAFPMRNVYEVRVLPYADRVQWFADHGMPQAEAFVGADARAPYVEPRLPPVVYVGDDDPELGPWLDWVESDGRLAFATYVLTHPLYLVTEPLHSPERAFNNALGDRQFYAPADLPRVPGVDRLLALPSTVVLMVAAIVSGWAYGRRRYPPVLVAGAVTAALAVPHGLLAWHSDGMETARHLVVPAMQLHLGVLLMVIGTVWGVAGGRTVAETGTDRSAAARGSGIGRSPD
jgi:hypothetical protein